MAHGKRRHDGADWAAEGPFGAFGNRHDHPHPHQHHDHHHHDHHDGQGPGRRRGGRWGLMGESWSAAPDDDGRRVVLPLITALRQVGVVGDDAQRRAARAVIDGALRAIWSILAEGPTAAGEEEARMAGDGEAGAATEA